MTPAKFDLDVKQDEGGTYTALLSGPRPDGRVVSCRAPGWPSTVVAVEKAVRLYRLACGGGEPEDAQSRAELAWRLKSCSVFSDAPEDERDPRQAPTPHIKRVIFSLHIENDTPGDWDSAGELISTLREYIDMIERGRAGRELCEEYVGPRGSRLTATCSELLSTSCIPLAPLQLPGRPGEIDGRLQFFPLPPVR